MSDLIRKSVDAMEGYVPGEQPKSADFVKLNTNENPYPPSPAVAEAINAISLEELKLYPNPTSDSLRAKIAEMHGCAESNVFVGNGSDEVLALCTRAFVEDDGSIGYFEPSYSLYTVLADIRAVEQKPLALDGDFQIGPLNGYDCSLFFLTNPNAPTGILYSKETVRELCEALSGVVVIDEAYVDFSSADCVDLALSMDNVLVARTFSKSYSLAGIRMGYMLGPERLIAAMFKLKDSYNCNMLSQQAALAAVTDVEHMRGNVAKITATRARLSTNLESRGFTVFPSETNFIWTRPPSISSAELFERLREERVLVRYFTGERTADFIRITVGSDAQIDMLLEAFDKVMEIGK